MKTIFDGTKNGTKISQPWQVQATEGTTYKTLDNGIEFTIEAWQEGREMWPRLVFSSPGIDLSDYSTVKMQLENPTNKTEDIAIVVAETVPKNVSQVVSLPPHSTVEVTVNISDGAPMDQSNVRLVYFFMTQPLTSRTFVLKKISAVANPDYIAVRHALAQRLVDAVRVEKSFSKNIKADGADIDRVQAAQHLIESAKQEFEERSPGYVTDAQKKLDTAQQNMAKLSMTLRKTDRLVWSSPLGLTIREGTLPNLDDQALSEINKRVCLNEYEAICINVSVADTAQTVHVNLKNGSAPTDFITLRPTLFSKARDGSQTADAIGTPSSELTLEVAPFQTRQFIVWVNTKDQKVSSGRYTASVELTSADAAIASQTIPIEIDVTNIRLSSTLPLNILNYAYFYVGSVQVTKGIEEKALANLRDYGINTWLINYDQVPLPLLDKTGEYIGLNANDQDRVKRFRQVMDLLKGHPKENFIIWLGFHRQEVRELLSRPGVLKGYLKDLHHLLDEYQIPLEKRYIQFWDEPQSDQVQESIDWMKKIRALDPTFKFFDNTSAVPAISPSSSEYANLVDILMPNWEQLFIDHPEKAKEIEKLKVPHLGFYRCLMSRNNRGVNIYEYYRLMSWYLMQNGFDTLGFWTYNAGGGEDPWDGTVGAASGGIVVYNKDGNLLTSRRWELFREGLDDYKLMQAAFGNDGVLDANKNSELMSFCRQVTEHPTNIEQADATREKLISIALQRNAH